MTVDQCKSVSWALEKSTSADVDELMTWFPDAKSVEIWGGPAFRYPFTRRTFRKDCRLRVFSSFSLRDPAGQFIAFGQIGSRYLRPHLARLVTRPDIRAQGVGKKLITMMIETIDREEGTPECGLFVFKHNLPALHCYQSLGFEIQEYPDGARMSEQCFYMTKLIQPHSGAIDTTH